MLWTWGKRLAVSMLLCAALTCAGVAEDVPPEAKDLLDNGDKLAEEGKYDEALLTYKNAYEKVVPVIRKLEFKESVQPRFMNRNELRSYMTNEFQKEYTPEELKLTDRSLKVFGLVPNSIDVRELQINLLTEEVGGFYNPDTKEMYLIREEVKKGNFLTRLFSGPEFSPEEQRITLSHEMTHALSDQHFDLQSLDKIANGNDDMSLAISALIEGEATLVMMSEIFNDNSDVTKLSPDRIDLVFQVMNMVTPLFGGRTLRAAPKIFRETLIFPYHQGCVFVLRLTNKDGWDAINRAFHEPPISTEQILHPEKFAINRDDPTAIELPKIEQSLGGKWKLLGQNTLGELQTQILFESSPNGKTAAEGWDGDRYSVLERDDGHLALAWFTTWDSAADARQFSDVAVPWFAQVMYRHATGDEEKAALQTIARESSAQWSPDDGNGTFQKDFEDRSAFVELRGQDVIVITGFDANETKQVADAMWQSQKAPLMVHR